MFKRTVKHTIAPNQGQLQLPVGTHKTADISVMSDGAGAPLRFTHAANNPSVITFPSSPTVRKVIVTVSQEYPFHPHHLQTFRPRPFTFLQSYAAHEMVSAYGGLYLCDRDYVNGAVGTPFSIRDLKPLSYPVGSIQYTVLDTLGEGWARCDGSVINAPQSLLHGYTTPDLRNRYPSGGNYNLNTPVGGNLGRYLGSNTSTIDVRNLPSNTFNVNISQDPQKVAWFNQSLLLPTDTVGDPDGATDTNGGYPRAYWRGREWKNDAHALVPAHGHSGSVQLNPQGQLNMENRPASVELNAFIRL